jgi:hypothetical protein
MASPTSESCDPKSVRAERRAHRRAALDRPVMIETSSRTLTVRSIDVSGGGIALRTDAPLAEGESVGVYFELPIRYGVEGRAEVVRRDSQRVVLRFTEIPHEAVVAVRSFCRISGVRPAESPLSSDASPKVGIAQRQA